MLAVIAKMYIVATRCAVSNVDQVRAAEPHAVGVAVSFGSWLYGLALSINRTMPACVTNSCDMKVK